MLIYVKRIEMFTYNFGLKEITYPSGFQFVV